MSISQLTNVIRVIEPAEATGDAALTPNTVATTLLIDGIPISGSDGNSNVSANEQLIQTYATMLVGRPVLQTTIEKLGLQETPEELSDKISVETIDFETEYDR